MGNERSRRLTEDNLAAIVEQLCSDSYLPRNTGAKGAAETAVMLVEALQTIGLAPAGTDGFTQDIPDINGTNVLGAIPGRSDRWIVLGAHYDACGWDNPGAGDNAAGVAITLEVAERLLDLTLGHSVLVALFDAEEPPNFLTPQMGSQWFVDHPTIPLDRVDTVVCLDVVGHALGPAVLPNEVRQSVFVLGAERGSGTPAFFDGLPAVEGIVPRRVDSYISPAMSDYHAFMERSIPFLFYTCGRTVDYHMPTDTPDKLDYSKMAALVDHLEVLIIELARRPEQPTYVSDGVDDVATVTSLAELTAALRPFAADVALVDAMVERWCRTLEQSGSLSIEQRREIAYVVFSIEESMA